MTQNGKYSKDSVTFLIKTGECHTLWHGTLIPVTFRLHQCGMVSPLFRGKVDGIDRSGTDGRNPCLGYISFKEAKIKSSGYNSVSSVLYTRFSVQLSLSNYSCNPNKSKPGFPPKVNIFSGPVFLMHVLL